MKRTVFSKRCARKMKYLAKASITKENICPANSLKTHFCLNLPKLRQNPVYACRSGTCCSSLSMNLSQRKIWQVSRIFRSLCALCQLNRFRASRGSGARSQGRLPNVIMFSEIPEVPAGADAVKNLRIGKCNVIKKFYKTVNFSRVLFNSSSET